MRYLITNLPLELGEERQPLAELLARALGGGPADYAEASLERLSLDARHKGSIRFLAAMAFHTGREVTDQPPPGAKVEPAQEPAPWTVAAVSPRPRVVIVGSGPAGTFCALRLLDYGIEPVVLERGAPMAERVRAVAGLWQDAVLDPEANAQFGEGGAGTFSDGKLTTRIGHPAIRYVLETFVRHGADPKVLYLARPHVGTDVIRKCSVLIRKDAEARGAVYRFGARLADLRVQDGAVTTAPGTPWRCCTGTGWPCARRPSPWACGWNTPRTWWTTPSTAPTRATPAWRRRTTSWCATWARPGPPTPSACARAAR